MTLPRLRGAVGLALLMAMVRLSTGQLNMTSMTATANDTVTNVATTGMGANGTAMGATQSTMVTDGTAMGTTPITMVTDGTDMVTMSDGTMGEITPTPETTPSPDITMSIPNATTPGQSTMMNNSTAMPTATAADTTASSSTTQSMTMADAPTAQTTADPSDLRANGSIVDNDALLRSMGIFTYKETEYEGYDGWYNNLAHPDWGGAELPLTRRLPVAYADGVYAMAGEERPNPINISQATMQGKTGRPSHLKRTAFMTFFGQQVVEEILDAQRAGCPREYENIEIPKHHFYRDEAANPDYGPSRDVEIMPFVRSRYSFNTGYSPNVPREQLNEITPWIDGGLMYGTTKAWADALRSFKDGRLADNSDSEPSEPNFPEENLIGLPMANPPNPIGNQAARLKDATRFFKLGNPRGNENPFLLTFGILWFRWHNYWADKFKAETSWNDEQIFNEARKWVIATYQSVVFYEWLPAFLNMGEEEMASLVYSGYKGYIHPGITHEFQSAAMRFGHTLVPPGVMRRNQECQFRTSKMESTGFDDYTSEGYGKDSLDNHGVRTCNSFWNPQLSVRESDIEEYLLGMASQVTEREDNIITEDLQKRVFGPLEFSRRDLMATNIQRGRDHGLPDYNTARVSLGLARREDFDDIRPDNDTMPDGTVTFISDETIEALREVHDGIIDNVDIWTGGLMETTSDGPGELFRFIIMDQFVRSRDADRFWFENELNGQFTSEQIDFIRNITVWDIITACTDIEPDNLQRDPFHYTEDDPCYAEQPFVSQGRTISEDDMEECTKLQTFDYFEGSEVSFALSFLAVGIWTVGCVAVLLILAHIRQRSIQQQRKMQHKRTRSKNPSNLKSYAAAEWCGKKEGTRPVQVKLGPGKKIRVLNERGNKAYRTVDLTTYTKVSLLVSPDGHRRFMVVKFEREYDIVLKFTDEEARLEFISDIESFLGSAEVGLGRERQEIREVEMLKMAVTKEHRTKLLEKFFKTAFSQAFKLDFDPEEAVNQRETKDILACELTKTEFAEVLSMKPDSLFVEQMFELVDQDNSGTISFREFLDVIVVFAKGQPEDKLKLMFNMYDIDRSGQLSRDEFRHMLKSMMEIVSASVEEQELDKVIQGMFDHAGLGDKESLSLQDFINLMADHKQELESATLQLAGDIPIPKDKAGPPPGRGAATVIRRGNLNARARQTIIRAYKDRDTQSGGKGATNGAAKSSGGGAVAKRAKSVRVETQPQREYPDTKTKQWYTSLVRYFENNRLKIFWVVLYLLVLFGVFAERAYYYSVEREFAGLRRIAGYGVTVTRGAASAMMFTYSCILVTMCRNLITKMRETFLHRYFPFDEMLWFHKFIALLALFFSVMHTIGHSINFYHISTQTADDLSCYFRDFFHRSHELPKFHYWAWGTITGFTGILLVMLCAVIYTFAFSYARRRVFNLFWLTHNTWVIYFILMFLHGSGRLVQPPFTHYFALGPLILFTLDKLVSVSRKKAEIAVTRAENLPSEVTFLEFKRPQGFEYKSGQWVRIACQALSSSEYHPFTLTSSPHEENLSLHIRAVGPWTMNLRSTYDPNVLREHSLPKLFLDGPYGEGHQDWYQFEVAVLVGGGIGVTPFASILKDIVHRSSIGSRITCKKVYFIWVTRTQKHYEWLTDIIREVEENDKNDLVSVHIFVTQFFQKFDLRTTMLYICERHFQKISNRSLFTGLRSITHFGRPQFTSFLQSLEDEHPGVGKIGVFSCGPPGMTNGVEAACVELNKYDGAAFIHHFENF